MSYIPSNGIYRCLACTTSPETTIQAIATVRGLALVYETPAQIRGGACTEVSLGGGVAHAYGYTIGYTIGYTMVLVLAHYTWQYLAEYRQNTAELGLLGRTNLLFETRRNPSVLPAD